ncbi:MAG: hypothetical protein ABEJ43_05620 [Haloferacaceae archaeon]
MSTRRPRGLAHDVSAHDVFLLVLPLPTLLGVASGTELARWVGPLLSAAMLAYGLFVAPPSGATGRSG